MSDCVVLYYESFKEKIKLQKELEKEMIRKHGKNKFKMTVLENCIYAEFKSERVYF